MSRQCTHCISDPSAGIDPFAFSSNSSLFRPQFVGLCLSGPAFVILHSQPSREDSPAPGLTDPAHIEVDNQNERFPCGLTSQGRLSPVLITRNDYTSTLAFLSWGTKLKGVSTINGLD